MSKDSRVDPCAGGILTTLTIGTRVAFVEEARQLADLEGRGGSNDGADVDEDERELDEVGHGKLHDVC